MPTGMGGVRSRRPASTDRTLRTNAPAEATI
jgi:hypothetical protein